MADVDAVVVGAGPNGLAAAVVLAHHGLSVELHEAAAAVGGGARTEELTLPGFRHDPCSAVHPLGAGSPLFRALPLEKHGLEWVHPDLPLAHAFRGGRAAVLNPSLARTADALGEDGARYRRMVGPFVSRWDELTADLLRPLTERLPSHPLLAARFGVRAAPPAAWLARWFRKPETRALMAGVAAHAICPLGYPATGGVAAMFSVAAHVHGWPFPKGGSQAISDALAAHLVELGGRIVLNHEVTRLDDLPAARAYVLDVSAPTLARVAESRFPMAYLSRLERVRPGAAVFKLDYALSEPVPWSAPEARRAGTVHVGESYEQISDALHAVTKGQAPERPFLIAAQPTLWDHTRAPEGRHVLWVYGHVPYGWKGDLTGAIEAQLERFAPGFRDAVLARASAGPAELEARNANYTGGDIAAGRFGGLQAIFRPVVARVPYATPDPSVYLCSSATPPGPGVHGMCGAHAAAVVLRRRFGVREPEFWDAGRSRDGG